MHRHAPALAIPLLALLCLRCGSDDDPRAPITITPGAGTSSSPGGSGPGGAPAPGGASGSTDGQGGAASGAAGQGGAPGAGGASGGAGASGAAAGAAGASGAGAAGASGASGTSGAAGASGASRYLPGVRHSPMSAGVVARLRAVLDATAGRPDVFAKVGDSNTVSNYFARCFATADVDLAAHAALEPTRAFFAQTKAAGAQTSYDRATLAAAVGWSAAATVAGSPTPIEQEVAAIAPAFAVVMLGTNDTYEQGVAVLDRGLLRAVDQLLDLGVVPLVTTIPPRGDKPGAAALVPEMNAVVRAVAQQRQVPYLDLWQLLEPLPAYGLVGDGVHLDVHASGGPHGCWFTDAALAKGMNQRNLITLEALDRARRFLLAGEAPEPAPAPLAGSGTWSDPFVIDALPFVDDGDTTTGGAADVDAYGCSSADESGRERVYRVTVPAPTRLSVRVFDGEGVDVDIHALSSPDPSACLARDDRRVVVDAPAGDLWLVVDTFAAQGQPQAGPYRLTVTPTP